MRKKFYVTAWVSSSRGGFIRESVTLRSKCRDEIVQTVYAYLRNAALAKFGTIDGRYGIECNEIEG